MIVFQLRPFLVLYCFFFFFQAEDGIRDRSPSRGLGDVYKRQLERCSSSTFHGPKLHAASSSRRSIIDLNFGRRSSRSLEQPLVPISSSGRPQRLSLIHISEPTR